jgi:hypothetical protein
MKQLLNDTMAMRFARANDIPRWRIGLAKLADFKLH